MSEVSLSSMARWSKRYSIMESELQFAILAKATVRDIMVSGRLSPTGQNKAASPFATATMFSALSFGAHPWKPSMSLLKSPLTKSLYFTYCTLAFRLNLKVCLLEYLGEAGYK